MRMFHSGRRAGSWAPVSVVAVALLLGGCSNSSLRMQADDPLFAGLDPAVVQEVLASDAAAQVAVGSDEESARLLYQGMVMNFSACRSALEVYQTWTRTGQPPAYPAQPEAENPGPMQAEDQAQSLKDYQRAIEGGDITVLRNLMANPNGGCGTWIPAQPWKTDGPTIADVVNGKA